MKPPEEQSEFIELIKDAIRAPSSHNTQPWKFQIRENQIIIKPDFLRKLQVVDPDDHALFISLGCALENLTLSAKANGYTVAVTMNLENHNDEIIVDLKKSESEVKDELYDSIHHRQCTRNEYDPSSIDQTILDQLKGVVSNRNVEIIFFTSKTEIAELKPLIIEASNLQFNNKKFVDELVRWIRFNERSAKNAGDGLWASVIGSPNVPKPIGSFVLKHVVSAKSEAKKWKNLIDKSAGFALFVARENSKTNWIQLGQCFERFALKATQMNIKHAHVNMPCEEIEVRNQLIEKFQLRSRHPLLLIRFGLSGDMPWSFRRDVESVLA